MAQTTQQPILKMEIIDNCIFPQHLVGGGKVWVCLIELGPSRGLMAQESSTVVSVMTGGLLRQSVMRLVLPILYLMLRWNCCKYVDHF
jgi:hypothetical protein